MQPFRKTLTSGPAAYAKAAGLRYTTDAKPGITRRRTSTGFRYLTLEGTPLKDPDTLARIRSLAIPPAYTDVWICPLPNGHLQATGRDARGRKQSRYHPHWREVRDETKYERMMHFGAALPGIRQRVDHDLTLPGLPRKKVLATIVRLMETTHIRVGNEEYARTNKSYGLTTLRNRHVDVSGATVHFSFRGKSGVEHAIDLQDRRIANIIKRCHDIPGHELFQFLDHDGNHHSIDSSDVNDYIREITEGADAHHFTAKDFRTWAGTVLACMTLTEFEPFETATQAKKNMVQAIAQVAAQLGNTPSVCRKCYIHPAVLDSYLSGTLHESLSDRAKKAEAILDAEIAQHSASLREEEQALLYLLEQRLALTV